VRVKWKSPLVVVGFLHPPFSHVFFYLLVLVLVVV